MALYELQKGNGYEVITLLTTVTEEYERISMHGVRNELLEQQAESIGLPLEKMYITKKADNEQYMTRMEKKLLEHKDNGISLVAYGDIFLEDLRKYREDNLKKVDMKAIFPLWKRDTASLSREFIELGFKTRITCIDSRVLDKSFVGRVYDESFLNDLPDSVDPCGENGEFHSFVFDGPNFSTPIKHETGEIVLRNERFYFCDLVPL